MKQSAGILAFLLALLVLGGAGTTKAGEPVKVKDPQPILQELQRKMSSLDSVWLDFTQERQLKLFSEPLKSEGVMLIARPDQIRWETTAPYQSILMARQKSVAQFEFDNGKWKKLKMGFPQLQKIMDQMALMHQGKLEGLTTDFDITAATNGMTIITLVPKDKNVRGMMSSIQIHLLPDLSATREVVMHEPSGDLTRIIFTREVRDVKFPAGTFDVEKPLDLAAVKAAIDHAK